RVIQAAQIRLIIFCENYAELPGEIEQWNSRGTRLRYFVQSGDGELVGARSGLLRDALKTDIIPVVALEARKEQAPSQHSELVRTFQIQALDAAERCGASKIFFLSPVRGLEIDGTLQSHPSAQEVEGFLKSGAGINIGRDELSFIHEQSSRRGLEIVLLEGRS